MALKLCTATEDDARVVAQQIFSDMFMKIANNEAAIDCAIVACEWIIDSWKRDYGLHFSSTAKCWESVKYQLQKMKT